jgi:hypothetical protein
MSKYENMLILLNGIMYVHIYAYIYLYVWGLNSGFHAC